MRTRGRGLGCVHGADGGAGLGEEEEGDGSVFGVSEDCGENVGGGR